MKKLAVALVVLIVLLLAGGFGLQHFLTRGLPTTLNNRVFPAVRDQYGLDLFITGASVNLLHGTVSLEGFAVGNLEGYEEPLLFAFEEGVVDVSMRSLLRRNPIVVNELRAKGVALTVERNREGSFNVQELAQRLDLTGPAREPDDPVRVPAPPRPPDEEPPPPLPVHIQRIELHALVTYVDELLDRPYTLDLRLSGSDLFTVADESHPDTQLALRGALVDDRASFVTDLALRVEPLTDPENPTFHATGTILNISADLLGDLLRKNNMESPSFSISPSIDCRKGRLDGSRIELILNDLSLYGNPIGTTRLALPVRGTMHQPTIDLAGALQSLLSEQAAAIGMAIGQRHLQKHLGLGEDSAVPEALLEQVTGQIKLGENDPIDIQTLLGQLLSGQPQPAREEGEGEERDRPETDEPKPPAEKTIEESLKQLDPDGEIKDALRSLRDAFRGR